MDLWPQCPDTHVHEYAKYQYQGTKIISIKPILNVFKLVVLYLALLHTVEKTSYFIHFSYLDDI